MEVDTSYFIGNAPGWVRLLAADVRAGAAGLPGDPSSWREVLPKTRVQPDTRHRFAVHSPRPATHVRLDVIPDGGLARLRLDGELEPEALAGIRQRWRDASFRPEGEGEGGPDDAG